MALVPEIDPWDHHKSSEPFLPFLTVDEGSGPEWTGLWDAHGRRLFRHPEALGFHHPLSKE